MFGRRYRRERTADGVRPVKRPRPVAASVGIGSLVVIRSEPGGRDAWDGEPSGVVIAPGDSELISYPGLSFGPSARWLIAFDELAYMSDGRGPFEQASVPGWQLVPVCVVDDELRADEH
jgi:hypothetical protein